MNSLLGSIQLGIWELGAVEPISTSSGAFTCTPFPDVKVRGIGAVGQAFSSVLGTIVLGQFQLGQVPADSVTDREVTGRGSFRCRPFPDIRMLLSFSGSFTCTPFPDVKVRGNKGAILATCKPFPDVVLSPIEYHATGSFTCIPFPDVRVEGIRTGAFICKPFPDVKLFPRKAQPVDCLAGPNPPEAEVLNYVY